MCSTSIGNAFSFFIFLIHFLVDGRGFVQSTIFKVRSGVVCQPVYIVCFLSIRFPLIDMRYDIIIQ